MACLISLSKEQVSILCGRRPIDLHSQAVGRRKKTPETDPKVGVGYLRVSTDEQKLGPEAQKAAINVWAQREGVQIVAWHLDDGVSGGAKVEKRKGLLEAISSLEEHKAGVLVIQKRDRLARDVMIAGMIKQLVSQKGARVVSADGASDDEGSAGLLIRGIMDLYAEYERVIIGERTRAALRAKRKRGEALGNTPYGFRKDVKKGPLIKDPQEQEIIAEIKRLRATGLSLRAIVKTLNDRGTPSRKSRWHLSTVADLLKR